MIAAPSLHGTQESRVAFCPHFFSRVDAISVCIALLAWVLMVSMPAMLQDYCLAFDVRCVEALLAFCRARSGKVDRGISTGRLHVLPRFHLRPINVVFFHGSDSDICF